MSSCRFCQQWNPPGAHRCAFCQNLMAAESDQTLAGRSSMTAQQVAAIPKAQRSMFDSARGRSAGTGLVLSPRQWRAVGAAVVFVIGLLLHAIIRC